MDEFEQRSLERRRSMTAWLARSKAEAAVRHEALDRSMPPAQRAEAVWTLTWELWSTGGRDGGQRRLDRSVARLERRRR